MIHERSIQKRSAGRRPKSGKADCDTRSQILSAARCVFAKRGLDGASVREVAEAAKVNNAMIYYHFTDKFELYRAVLSDSFAAFDRIWDHQVFNTPAGSRVKIQKYVEELIRFQHGNEELRRILSMEFASCGRNFKWLGDNLFSHSFRKLSDILKEGMQKGELRKVQPSIAIATLVGMVIHSFIMRPVAEYVSGKKMNLDVKRFSCFVTGMFFDGLAAEGQSRGICRPVKLNIRTMKT
jgi:AcrR family transcriptional regulator